MMATSIFEQMFWRFEDAMGGIVTESGETDEKKKVCQRINNLMTD